MQSEDHLSFSIAIYWQQLLYVDNLSWSGGHLCVKRHGCVPWDTMSFGQTTQGRMGDSGQFNIDQRAGIAQADGQLPRRRNGSSLCTRRWVSAFHCIPDIEHL